MGRGNVCAPEGGEVYYLEYEDNSEEDYFDIYLMDEIELIYDRIMKKFPSFWRTKQLKIENRLFSIYTEDNQWSTAIIVEPVDDTSLINLQKRHIKYIAREIERILLEYFEGRAFSYGGPWTSCKLSK